MIQQQTQPARLACQPLGLLHLPEDLRLAQYHRVQSAGNPECVPDRLGMWQQVRGSVQVVWIDALFVRDELGQGCAGVARLVDHTVQLGPVAGRDDRRLAQRAGVARAEPLAQARDGSADLVRNECDPLSQGQRGALVVQSHRDQLHLGQFDCILLGVARRPDGNHASCAAATRARSGPSN